MNGRCSKCNRELTTGDFNGLCKECIKKETTFDIPLYEGDILTNEEYLKKLAKALKPYIDSIPNSECKKGMKEKHEKQL